MAQDRPAKQAIRALWLQALIQYAAAYPQEPQPLYLTLSGAEGRDIQLLVDHDLLKLTETGAVTEEHKGRVVAVESSAQAVVALQRKFPGLKIVEQPFPNLVRHESPFRWPEGSDEQLCRARVVNLDLNHPLIADENQGEVRFPTLAWISKLSQIHAAQHLDWTLCLTLHGETVWSPGTCRHIQEFLTENFDKEPEFADAARRLLGDSLFEAISGGEAVEFGSLPSEEQQKILMIFVPKKISHALHTHGWRVTTERNLRYGGGGVAPMVTWIVSFVWEPQALRQPDAIYRACLRDVLTGAAAIAEDGNIS